MTYPPYPPQGQPQYPPQGGYPQPGYQAPPPPAYAPPAPAPAYPQQYNGYPPQYAQPAAPPQPALARGSLEDYLDQPTAGGGTSVTKFFQGKPQGAWLQFQISRDLTNSDVRQQTDVNGVPQVFKDGKPKFVLIVPVIVLASSDGTHPGIFTDGGAGTLWLKGVTSDSWKQAMAAAGIVSPDRALAGGKLGGAFGTMVSAGEKPSNRPGFSATKLYNFQYQPGGREMTDTPDPTALPVTAPTSAVPAAVAPPVAPGAAYPTTAATQTAPAIPAAPTASAPAVPAPVPMPPQPPTMPAAPAAAPIYPTQPPPAPVQYAAPMAPPAPVSAPPTAAGYAAPPPPSPGPNGQQPVPPGAVYDPNTGQPLDPEKAALLARLQGQG